MADRRRISLTFGDSPNEELAYAILQTKGRKKAAYVAACIASCEKKKSQLPDANAIEVLKTLLEQIIAAHPLSPVSAPIIEQTTAESGLVSQVTTNVPAAEVHNDVAGGTPVQLDPDLATQALDALSMFDAF